MVGLHRGIVCQRAVINHLRILKAGTVKEVDEAHVLLLAVIPNPSPQQNLLSGQFLQALLQLPCANRFHILSRSSSAFCAYNPCG